MEGIIQKTGIVFLLGMYLYSGVNKAFTFEGTRNAIKNKFPIKLPDFIYTLALVGVILLLTVGSSIVGYTVFTDKLGKISSYIIIALILFTIAATLMFHFPSEKEKYHFMKNMSIIGGFLILLSSFISRQSKIVN